MRPRLPPRPRPRNASIALLWLSSTLGCNEGLQPSTAPTTCPTSLVGICGRVRFRGAVPDSTAGVFVIAYAQFPRSRNDLFSFQPAPPLQSLPLTDSTAFYAVSLPNGRYEWVLAVWQKKGTITLQNADSLVREAGAYRDPADFTKFGVVVVNGIGTDSIDFVVDFTNMHPVSYFFPAPGEP